MPASTRASKDETARTGLFVGCSLTKGQKLLYVLEGKPRRLQLGQQPELRSLRAHAKRGMTNM